MRSTFSCKLAVTLPLFVVNVSLLLALLSWPIQTVVATTTTASASMASSQKKKTYDAKISRRERNLDHWDAETLAAYLGLDPDTALPLADTDHIKHYTGIDAGIMFYAQWCENCHRFAPVWDAIATMLQAGSTQSNLIMALFNCEQDDTHVKLCDAAGVTHYPTLMFVGAGPFPDITGSLLERTGMRKKSKRKRLKRTMKFRGDLNVGDSVLDWIKVMRGLSTWYKWNYGDGGWLKFWRNGISHTLGMLLGTKKNMGGNTDVGTALPVGIPPGFGGLINGEVPSSGSYVLQKELKAAEKKVDGLEKDLEDYKLAAAHAGYLIEAFLFPPLVGTKGDLNGHNATKPADAFTEMMERDVWSIDTETSQEVDAIVLKSCVVDLTLDYCTRLSTKLTTDYLNSLVSLPDDKYPSFVEMETILKDQLKDEEPYCAILHSCYTDDFKRAECRPAICPFAHNAGACTYVASCLTEFVQEEYAIALGKSVESLKKSNEDRAQTSVDISGTGDAVPKDQAKKATASSGGGAAWGIK